MPFDISDAPLAARKRIAVVVPVAPRPVEVFVLVSIPVTMRVPEPTRVTSPAMSSARKAPRRRTRTSEPPATDKAPIVSEL